MAFAVPNFSEGRDPDAIGAITAAFERAELIDRHSDEVHNRTVLNLVAPAGQLAEALVDGARACIERIDIYVHSGAHPCVGSLDVCPIVWIDESRLEAARTLALDVGEWLGDALELPVFLYGDLATSPEHLERAELRRGGAPALAERMRSGELKPDFGPSHAHPTAGAVLVTARPPLAAFNVELDTADVSVAAAIASRLRESGGGPSGVRAMAVDLGDRAQVSTNIHDPLAVPLGAVIERVRELAAEHGAVPIAGEVVGLVAEGALRDLPADVPLVGFDPDVQVLERRLGDS